MALSAGARLKALLAGDGPVLAPLATDPLAAKLAVRHGFGAVYLGGGALGYITTATEARLTSSDVVDALRAITNVSDVAVIVDGTTGFGDPIHVERTVREVERAGGAAIELEDQLTPKHAHHQKGIDHPIPLEAMVEKVEAAVAARADPDFLIIARTNTIAEIDIEEGVKRAQAYAAAGADLILVLPRTAAEYRRLAAEIAKPLVTMSNSSSWPPLFSAQELGDLGYRLLLEPTGPLLAAYAALTRAYDAIRAGAPLGLDPEETARLRGAIDDACDLPALWELETRTTEQPHRVALKMGVVPARAPLV